MVTMLLGGLWHGAGWTFVIWGGLHGIYLVINHAWHGLAAADGPRPVALDAAPARVLARTVTFLAVVVAWVYFRAEGFDAANRILAGMVGLNGVQLPASYDGTFGSLAPTLEALGWAFRDSDGFHFGGIQMVVWLAALFGISFLMPNTQEWTGYIAPNAERGDATEPSLFGRLAAALPQWRPTLVHGSVLGAVLCWCLLAAFAQTPSEFLYFQF